MISNKTLHYLSYLKFVFFGWMMVITITVFIAPKDKNTISKTGYIILLMGVTMGFEGLSDTEKMSNKEKKELSTPKIVKKQSRLFFSGFIVSIALSLFFISTKFFMSSMNDEMAKEFTRLGCDCLVMGLGFLCLLKLLYDRASYVKSLNNTTKE